MKFREYHLMRKKLPLHAGADPAFRGNRSFSSLSLFSFFSFFIYYVFSNVFVPGGDRELNSPLSPSRRRDIVLLPIRNRAGCRAFSPEMSRSEKTCLSPGPKCCQDLVSDEQLNKVEASICDDARIRRGRQKRV